MYRLIKVFSIILIISIFFSSLSYASVIDEKQFKDFGYLDNAIEKNQNKCYEYTNIELNTEPNYSTVLQLKIKNYIPVNDGVTISIYLNDIIEKTIANKDIKEKNIIPLNKLKNNNSLKICVDNSFLPTITISKESTIGTYLLAEIKEENFFQTIQSTVPINKLIPIIVSVKNTGYDSIYIELDNANNLYIENSKLKNVSGDVEYKGLLAPNETKTLTYYFKTNNEANLATPRAILNYTTEFGEAIKLLTTPEIIKGYEDQSKLEVFIDVSKENVVEQELYGKLILRNVSENVLKDVYIISNFNGTIELEKNKVYEIKPKDVIEIPFKIKTYEIKDYRLNFNVYYFTNDLEKNIGTNEIIIKSVDQDNTLTKLIASLLIISAILFIWIVKF
ncbi:MAG: hypothetical protein WCY27_03105 [archaeon]|nr:hypothetical protein [archaeon]MDD2477771.1 hypothetical protein [Candidatus ainarchaeum sp.]MDD4662857.1 hypothetical protein [Candidatus ainarchaeum sp.]